MNIFVVFRGGKDQEEKIWAGESTIAVWLGCGGENATKWHSFSLWSVCRLWVLWKLPQAASVLRRASAELKKNNAELDKLKE